MELIRSGTAEWHELQSSTVGYSERLNYKSIKDALSLASPQDIIVIPRPHSHYGNLVAGLSRQGLNHKVDYTLKMSVKEGLEQILIFKL